MQSAVDCPSGLPTERCLEDPNMEYMMTGTKEAYSP